MDDKEYLEAIRDMNEGQLSESVEKIIDKSDQANNTKEIVLVKIDDDGVVNFRNQIELSQAASFIIKMKLAPEHLRKEGHEVVMAALTLCKQFRLPLNALNEVAAIKGKVGVFGSLMTALAQRHHLYGDLMVQYINAEQEVICLKNKNLKDKVWACVVSVKKKGSSDFNEYYFTEDEARTAGLLSNNTYQKYLKDMLFHRAKARALQTEYASALKGIESVEDMAYEAGSRDISPVDAMNERLGLRKEEVENEK